MAEIWIRGIVVASIGFVIGLATSVGWALIVGAPIGPEFQSPSTWIVAVVVAVMAVIASVDHDLSKNKPAKSADRQAGENFIWSAGAVFVVGILIALVAGNSIMEVFSSPAFWIPAGIAILAATLSPYKSSKKGRNTPDTDELATEN